MTRHRQMRYSDLARLFEITESDELHIRLDDESYTDRTKFVQVSTDALGNHHNRGIVKVTWKRVPSERWRGNYTYEFIKNAPFIGTYFPDHSQIVEDLDVIKELLILATKVYRQVGADVYGIEIKKRENGRFDIGYTVTQGRELIVTDEFEREAR